MVPQEIFSFKLERTDELLTSRGGLTIFSEAMRALQVEKKIRAAFPHPGSNRGYEAWSYIEPLVLMLIGGGRHVEDLREIRDDQALRALIGLDRLPSSSTVGDWLMRWGKRGGRKAMTTVNEDVARTIVNRTGGGDLTLDIDGMVIESDKEEAEWTYKKVKGYQPILGFLAENSVCPASEFRPGNVPGHSQALKFFKRCLKLCPKIKTLQSDSAFYQADIIGWCQEKEMGFTITADQNNSVKEAIRTVRDWTPLMDKKGRPTDREVVLFHNQRGEVENENDRLRPLATDPTGREVGSARSSGHPSFGNYRGEDGSSSRDERSDRRVYITESLLPLHRLDFRLGEGLSFRC